MNPLNSSELPWEDNGEPTAERFYEMAWQNGKHGLRDFDFFKKAFDRYIAKHTQEARIDTVKALAEELNFTKGDYGHDEILDFLARLENGEAVTVAQLEQQERTLKPKTGGK